MSHVRRQRSRNAPGPVRRVLDDLGRGARKRLGQHFLANPETASRIVALAAVSREDRVVEIGPGLGALTEPLLIIGCELWLIELDFDLAARLRERWGDLGRVHVVAADVLETNVPELIGPGAPAVVVANLPYNIGAAILAHLLATPDSFARLVVMLQREVAERLRATPGSHDYSALSVLTQAVARVERGLRIGPGAFVPAPKVESEVVIITPHGEPPLAAEELPSFRRLVRTVFSQRRKQLLNSMRGLDCDPRSILNAAGIDPMRRPETLSLEEFAQLNRALLAGR